MGSALRLRADYAGDELRKAARLSKDARPDAAASGSCADI